jgi:antitoxin CptB
MRELDAVLAAFLERGFVGLDEADKQRFEHFLDLSDPELYGYLLGRDEPDDPDTARLVARIRRSLEGSA